MAQRSTDMPKVLEGGRRTSRLAIAIPLLVTGQDASGQEFQETTRTLVINKQGAKILSHKQLALGAELALENRALRRTAQAVVVWLGNPTGADKPTEVGVRMEGAETFWGIDFPPEDWRDGPPKIGLKGTHRKAKDISTELKAEASAENIQPIPPTKIPSEGPPPEPTDASVAPSPPVGLPVAGSQPMLGAESDPVAATEAPAVEPVPPIPAAAPERLVSASQGNKEVRSTLGPSENQFRQRYEEILLGVLKDFEKRMGERADQIHSEMRTHSQDALKGFLSEVEEVREERLADVEEQVTHRKKELEHVLEAAQTASDIIEEEREQAGEVVAEIEAFSEVEAEKARLSFRSTLDDTLKKVQEEVAENFQESLSDTALRSVEQRLADAREKMAENATNLEEGVRERFKQEARQVAQSVREELLEDLKKAQKKLTGTLDDTSKKVEGGMWKKHN